MSDETECISLEELEALASGQKLSADRDAHVENCQMCQSLINNHERFDLELGKYRLLSNLAPPKPALTAKNLASAAVVVVGLLVLAGIGGLGILSERDARQAEVQLAQEQGRSWVVVADQLSAQKEALENTAKAAKVYVDAFRRGDLSADALATTFENLFAHIEDPENAPKIPELPPTIVVAATDRGDLKFSMGDKSVTLPRKNKKLKNASVRKIREHTNALGLAKLKVEKSAQKLGVMEAMEAIQDPTSLNAGGVIFYLPTGRELGKREDKVITSLLEDERELR